MLFKSRSLLLAASLMAVPLATAIAQQNSTGSLGSSRSGSAAIAPGSADSGTASGKTTSDSGARMTANTNGGTAMNSAAPGATGRTIVPGINSSQRGSAASTDQEKTGAKSGDH